MREIPAQLRRRLRVVSAEAGVVHLARCDSAARRRIQAADPHEIRGCRPNDGHESDQQENVLQAVERTLSRSGCSSEGEG